jgi:hypothetical protein
VFRRGWIDAIVGIGIAALLFVHLMVGVVQRHGARLNSASAPTPTAILGASPTPLLGWTLPPTPTPTSAPTPTATPTAMPTAVAAPVRPRQCGAHDFSTHNGAVHVPGYQGDINAHNAHPGDRMILQGYPSFTPAAKGCVLPPATARLSVVDPAGHEVTWWSGKSDSWPQMTASAPSGCGCSGPGPTGASVLWMCASAGSCAAAPLGDYTLRYTITLNSGVVISSASLTMPTTA